LFMGTLTAHKDEILERDGQNEQSASQPNPNQSGHLNQTRAETRAVAFEHNETMGLSAGAPRLARPGTVVPGATMAEDILTATSPEPDAAAYVARHEFDGLLGKSFEEKPIWTGLYESIRDVFFPQKLPPLKLTSTPIPVPDRMKVKANPWAIGTAILVNGLILAAVLYFGARMIIQQIVKPPVTATNIDVGDFKLQGPKGPQAGGGGGGGDKSLVDPIKGRLPKKAPDPVTPPQVQTVDKPKLAIEPTINVQDSLKLPDNPNLPTLGVTKSANVTLASNGEGNGLGIGTGRGGGIGSGTGNGYGPGTGGNAGGGVYQVGGGISAPVPLNTVEAEFSDEARRAKYQGVCLISLIVDANGNPQNPRVVRPLGMGLDEKALEAVRQYKFKPAMKDGRTPVPVMITVEVNFRLY
jgi:periplasmic protein TonB